MNYFSMFVLVCLASATAHGTYLEGQEFMDPEVAQKKFGLKSFVAKSFRKGASPERATMAVDLIKSKKYIGEKPNKVFDDLGPGTGHFWNDNIPAYLLTEGWTKNDDTWQLVFLLDDSGRVSEVRIHKNCCPKHTLR